MTDKLRQAAEMALEALKTFEKISSHEHLHIYETITIPEAVKALRQALNQSPDTTKMMGLIPSEWAGLEEPPKREWVGLTDDERRAIGNVFENDNGHIPSWMSFARRIEAKLKEKNT
jgi:hypothetical protein